MDKMPLPQGVIYIIEKLNASGYRADNVGGSVRDFLLSRPCDDYDITTDASPSEVKKIFASNRIVDTGIKHGTVTVIVGGIPHEVTTYRCDGEYLDNRHPESVTFTSELADDLARRDFTVNAMCYSPNNGFTDLFGGMEDLAARRIRAVGDAEVRFDEDALRIFRAIRFASVLDFEIEERTSDAVHKKCALLSNVSRERIYVEWRKLLSGKAAYRIIDEYRDVIAAAIPELGEIILPNADAFSHAEYKTRLFSLYALSFEEADRVFSESMRALKTDNAIRILGESVLSMKGTAIKSVTDALNALKVHGREATEEYIKLGILLGDLDNSAKVLLDEALASGIPYKITDLAVGGRELIALGIRGQAVGETFSYLLECVISGEVANEREALIKCARGRVSEYNIGEAITE